VATWTPLWTRPLIALDALSFYICKLLVPTDLALIYGRTPVEAVTQRWIYYTWLLPAIAAIIVWQVRRPAPWAAAAALVFVIALLPVLGFTRFMFQIHSTVADHYMYLPMLAVALVMAGLVDRFGGSAAFNLAAAAMLILLAVMSVVQLGYWRDGVALFRRAVDVNPRSATARSNLGVALAGANQLDDALEHFRAAVAISPANRLAHTNLAQAYLFRGDLARAAQHANFAIRLAEDEPPHLRDTSWEQEILRRATQPPSSMPFTSTPAP
jgi:tetratricopeptide (TPR) repeat protein